MNWLVLPVVPRLLGGAGKGPTPVPPSKHSLVHTPAASSKGGPAGLTPIHQLWQKGDGELEPLSVC